MVFQCSHCKEVFESDGLKIIVHGQCISEICPACLAGKDRIQITIGKERPGKPFKFLLFQAEEGVYEVNNGPRDQTDPKAQG